MLAEWGMSNGDLAEDEIDEHGDIVDFNLTIVVEVGQDALVGLPENHADKGCDIVYINVAIVVGVAPLVDIPINDVRRVGDAIDGVVCLNANAPFEETRNAAFFALVGLFKVYIPVFKVRSIR